MGTTIYFHNEEVNYTLQNKKIIRQWILQTSGLENKVVGDINVVFTSDSYLHRLNVRHLRHDALTDIITFDYSSENQISGDIFISIERVKENASEYNIPFLVELRRIIIHGILHLLGYKDKTKVQKIEMRAKEDYYLSLLPRIMAKS